MDNFYYTAQRMWKDANVLHISGNSFFNTCYLAGYILECYGKLLVLANNPSANVQNVIGHKLTRIDEKIKNEIIITGRLGKYCLDLSTECNNIYNGSNKWSPYNRYEDNPSLWSTKQVADNFVTESKKIMDMIGVMKIDGVI